MKLIKNGNIYLLILDIIILFSFLLSHESFAQTSMPNYSRLSPIATNVNSPTDVALDASENIYVVESVNNTLLKFSQSGQYKNTITGMSKPLCVAVDNYGRIFIGNDNRNNVEVYDSGLNPLPMPGSLSGTNVLGSGNGEFTQPNSIDIDNNGNIYVVDYLQDNVKVFLADGSYYHCYGCPANGSGQLKYPSSIVIDKATQQVIILDHPLISGPYGELKGVRIQVFQVSASNWTLLRSFGEYGALEGQMNKPQGVEIDNSGRIYVTDSQYNIVYVYHSDCNVNGIANYCGKITDAANPMRTPMGMYRGNSNRLFIASLLTGKVEIYGITPYTNMQFVPGSLSFQGQQNSNNPPAKNVELRNNGTKNLDWTASTNVSWITLTDFAGSLNVSTVFNLGVGINMSGLSPNAYTGYVNIRSNSGAEESITVTLNVLPNPTIANPEGTYSTIEGQTILLNASNSSGELTRYEWDINYDGISDSYEYDTSSPTQSHIYNSQGTYAIKLRVTDQGSNTANATTSAEISDSVPTADFEGASLSGTIPLTVNFINYSTGYDQPLSYEWDFDNNGIVDSTEPNPSYIYSNPGIYSVKLAVRDSDGSTNTLIRPYYISVSNETCQNLPVRINGTIPQYFNTLQDAYNAAVQGDTIQVQTLTLSEYSVLNIDKTVTIEGGYDCNYLSNTGSTSINESITISNGVVTIGNFVLN